MCIYILIYILIHVTLYSFSTIVRSVRTHRRKFRICSYKQKKSLALIEIFKTSIHNPKTQQHYEHTVYKVCFQNVQENQFSKIRRSTKSVL